MLNKNTNKNKQLALDLFQSDDNVLPKNKADKSWATAVKKSFGSWQRKPHSHKLWPY